MDGTNLAPLCENRQLQNFVPRIAGQPKCATARPPIQCMAIPPTYAGRSQHFRSKGGSKQGSLSLLMTSHLPSGA
jgi:hypothetical protein